MIFRWLGRVLGHFSKKIDNFLSKTQKNFADKKIMFIFASENKNKAGRADSRK